MGDKIYNRKIKEEIKKYLVDRQCLIIYGPRQVGKTTVLKSIMQEDIKENVFYLDAEIPETLDLCNEGAEALYQWLLEHGAQKDKKMYVIIDEIQYLHNPTKFIKICHDHYPQMKLLVSGSSTFEMKKKFKQSLVGRTVTFELYPLSFEEFLLFKEKKYVLKKENLYAINKELIPLAEEFIRYGGYPQIVLEQTQEKKEKFLWQIINTYIRKDIREVGNVQNIDAFNNLLRIVAAQSGQLLNILEIANTINLNRNTVMEYLKILENTFIIKQVTPFYKNVRSEITKMPKVFVIDTGMMHLLWLKEFPKITHGAGFETYIHSELMKLRKEIHFWRSKQKEEVDFIVENKKLYAIEAKYQFKDKKRTNLPAFEKHYACKTFVVGLQGEKTGKYPWELIKEITERK